MADAQLIVSCALFSGSFILMLMKREGWGWLLFVGLLIYPGTMP